METTAFFSSTIQIQKSTNWVDIDTRLKPPAPSVSEHEYLSNHIVFL